MKTVARWWRFNLVGAAGMIFQLAVLALLTRLAPSHYLVDSAAALELTLLHNFVWHLRFTWRERSPARAGGLARFHLSNGLISLAGNLVLMRVLVQEVHLPVLVSNGIAILVCSLVNFCAGEHWVFTGRGSDAKERAVRFDVEGAK